MKQWILIGATLVATTSSWATTELVDGVAAIVNDKVITYSEVRQYVQPALLQLRRDFSGEALMEKVRLTQLDALNNLIDRALIVHEYNTKGYSLPDNIVDTQIDEIIATDFGGDRVAFVKTLQSENITLSQYRDRLRERVIIQAMRNRKMNQQVVISPYKIEKYYRENVAAFALEDQIKLRMIFIKKSAPPAEGNATETAGAADPQHALAEEILQKLKEKDSFESLARVYSRGREAKDGGDWGWIGRNILSKQLDEVAFGLRAGEHSNLIETPEGYYLLFVEDVKPAHTKPLAEVRDQIEKNLQQQERAKLQDDWVKQLRAKSYIRLY